MAMQLPKKVKVVEVGPRDGLQNEPDRLRTDVKVGFVDRLTAAGLQHIEVSSFVSPHWVPQLSDARAVFERIARAPDVVYSALVPNLYGLQRALEAGVRYIAVFTAASETFNQHNVNCSVAESLHRFEPVFALARAEGVRVRGYVSTAYGCPYEGPVAPERVAEVALALHDAGCEEISLGDTNGVAVPTRTEAVLECVAGRVPLDRLAVHFHDTFSRALANVVVALQMGVSTVDASAGGLGGCPYAPGASGNLATEDLLHLLHGLDIETGVSLAGVTDASLFMETALGRTLPSRYLSTVRE